MKSVIKSLVTSSPTTILTIFAVALLHGCQECPAQTNGWPQYFCFTNEFGAICCSNNIKPAQFEPDYEFPITNIVINSDYPGTIQVGTNFWTVKELEHLIRPVATFSPSDAEKARFAALSMIESGDDDRAIGKSGEVSRYQIMPAVWREYTKLPISAAGNPFTAKSVALAIMDDRYGPTYPRGWTVKCADTTWYLLWHRPATVRDGRKPTAREMDRALRFANLVQKFLTTDGH